MSDELCISMRIGDVCVEVAYPVRGDGALPYAVADLMTDTADAVLRQACRIWVEAATA